ncbi:MAG TPA: four helix bundle suffix domain-containing protein [Kiritimatiellia bacterium]|nr:four helix bundle suffix domain-containing protein [Kiritimatiellia bacterium]HPS09512.1 four helix bundle suffix domain-containing protein [Kiritimatiellia bacterium]
MGEQVPHHRTDRTDQTDPSDSFSRSQRLRPSGGYRSLRSFQTATVIYDATVAFCERFIDPRSRTVDQMVQASRSGRQNIAEGSRAAATSSQTELRLVNVARASLDELLLDYEDFLRQRRLPQWAKDDPEALAVRDVGRHHQTDQLSLSVPYARWLDSADSSVVANALICLIHQANYLLDQQIAALEQTFVKEGGYSEQLAAARREFREQTPPCPLCGKPMRSRTARHGSHMGQSFWGCTAYPECKGILPSDRSVQSD